MFNDLEAIVIGASAGGIEALLEILPALPAGFPVPVIFVIHLPSTKPNMLSKVFENKVHLHIKEADEKEFISPGTIYYAPSGYHLLIEKNKTFSLSLESPVLFSRPSIDVLFKSAAASYKTGLLGILLTGANTDGANGLKRIQKLGGTTIIQDPREAVVSLMPESGLPFVKAKNVLTLKKIADLFQNIHEAGKK